MQLCSSSFRNPTSSIFYFFFNYNSKTKKPLAYKHTYSSSFKENVTFDKYPATIPFFFFNLQQLRHSPWCTSRWWQIHSCSVPPPQKQSLPLTFKVKNQSWLPHADPSWPEATADPETWSKTPHLDRNQRPKPPLWVQLPSHLSHSTLTNATARSLLPEITPISRD